MRGWSQSHRHGPSRRARWRRALGVTRVAPTTSCSPQTTSTQSWSQPAPIDHAGGRRTTCSTPGKHLFLEKPGATTLAGHDALREAAAAHPDAVVQVGYHRRFDPEFAELRRLVASGAIGEPLLVLATSRDSWAPEPEDPRPAGGFLVDMAVHDYDAACWLLGQEPVETYVARQAPIYPELEQLGDLDNACVTISFDRGGIATTHVSRTCAFGHDIRTEVVGTEGSALIGNAASRPGVSVVTRANRSDFPVDYRERFADAYRTELAAFVAACNGDGPRGAGPRRRPPRSRGRRRCPFERGRRRVPRAVGVDWPWEADPES